MQELSTVRLPQQEIGYVKKDVLENDEEQYSSLNDSDSTDDEITVSLTLNQIKNILKSYIVKLDKWTHTKLNNVNVIKWLVSKKINYYQMKVKNWKEHYNQKKILIDK